MTFNEKLKKYQETINDYLDMIIPADSKYINSILDSMRYSVFAGGKRLRPILMLGTGEIFGCSEDIILPFAAGLEMIHTYSLIHDDLPAMDDDDYRRGKLTNHKVYGEGMAVLSGDALLNFAFEHMLSFAASKGDIKFTKASLEIAVSSGIYGMIGGQVIDIEHENKPMDGETLKFMHSCKTGALIKASVRCGAILSGAGERDMEMLTNYGTNVGLAFQIIDDILDVAGNEKKLGKKTRSDIKKNKPTYVSLYGIEKSRKAAADLTADAMSSLEGFGTQAGFLRDLTEYLLGRDY